MPTAQNDNIVALDIGERRIGVAMASKSNHLSQPYGVINNNEQPMQAILKLVKEHNVSVVVVGLPRGLEGQDTKQTKRVKAFASDLETLLNLPVHYQDEALTSKQAESELHQRGVKYNKEMVDALAATYILNDFLVESGMVHR